jgi:hypothetical protein
MPIQQKMIEFRVWDYNSTKTLIGGVNDSNRRGEF